MSSGRPTGKARAAAGFVYPSECPAPRRKGYSMKYRYSWLIDAAGVVLGAGALCLIMSLV